MGKEVGRMSNKLNEEIKRLQKLCDEATEGPGKTFDNGPWGGQGAGLLIKNLHNPHGLQAKDLEKPYYVIFGEQTVDPYISDSFFCAGARTFFPKVLKAFEVAVKEIKSDKAIKEIESIMLKEEPGTKEIE